MRAYLAIIRCRLYALFQYRFAALAGLGTQIFWGFIKVMILQAFYSQSTAPQPISLEQAITFIWLGQALLQLLPWNIDKEIQEQVRTGNVSYDLARPIDLYWYWFARSLAMRFIPTVMRSIPLFLIAGLFLSLSMPVSGMAAVMFVIALAFALLLASAITAMVIISLFWTVSGEGLLRLLPHVTLVLAGMAVPLPLFPDWMQPFLNLQPFRAVIDIPARLYTGVIPVSEAVYYFVFQLGWFLIFLLIGRWMMDRALKRVVINGG